MLMKGFGDGLEVWWKTTPAFPEPLITLIPVERTMAVGRSALAFSFITADSNEGSERVYGQAY
ncbi:glycoside hydrolase family 3 protein [Moniliophthora roreri]|nr:glycoside hydrolase family 3 protein [Moniliophthora roreri]